MHCVAIKETAAEKWVVLTRRVAGIDRGYYPKDMTLVRHVYDLAVIGAVEKWDESFYDVIKNAMSRDAMQHKNQYLEYADNPLGEIEKSLVLLKHKHKWETEYNNFLETMVYEISSVLNYIAALKCIEDINERLANRLL